MRGREDALLSLHNSLVHSGQKKAWQEDLKAFEELRADEEEELRCVRWQACRVVSLYFMFQAIILTAVSQPHLLTCALWWSPVFLSLAVSAATFLAITNKLYSMGELQEDIQQSSLFISTLLARIDALWEHGASMDLDSEQPTQEIPRRELAGLRFVLGSMKSMLALLFLAGFSAHMAIFSSKILCGRCAGCSG